MRKLHLLFLSSCLLFATPTILLADARPDAHSPISIMGDHTHKEGEFMFSYRFMSMTMEGNKDGSSSLSNSEILTGGSNTGDYLVVPTEMTMDMHMFGLMYAQSDQLTWMFMLPYLQLEMDHLISPVHITYPDQSFTTASEGIGDFKISGLLTLEKTPEHNAILGFGLSIPTGSIDEHDDILAMEMLGKTQLPFPMQLGSGTYDWLPSLAYNRFHEKRSWGLRASAEVRIGENDNGYTLGDKGQLQGWHAWIINKELSLSTRLGYREWGSISGDDEARDLPQTVMTSRTVQSVFPENFGGKQLEAGLGLNGVFGHAEHRVALEINIPLWEDLNGPQMTPDLLATLGYQKAFK